MMTTFLLNIETLLPQKKCFGYFPSVANMCRILTSTYLKIFCKKSLTSVFESPINCEFELRQKNPVQR